MSKNHQGNNHLKLTFSPLVEGITGLFYSQLHSTKHLTYGIDNEKKGKKSSTKIHTSHSHTCRDGRRGTGWRSVVLQGRKASSSGAAGRLAVKRLRRSTKSTVIGGDRGVEERRWRLEWWRPGIEIL